MATTLDFSEYARDVDLASDEFPYADKGPDKYSRCVTSLIWVFVFALFAIPTKIFYKPEYVSGLIKLDPTSKLYDLQVKGVDTLLDSINALISMLVIGFIISIAMFVIFVILYSINVVKRQRCFERDVVKNDAEAAWLKAQLLNSKKIDKQIRELKRNMKKGQSKKSGDFIENMFESYEPSLKDMMEMEALKAFKNCTVCVNTRQDIMGDDVEKLYRVIFTSPDNVESDESLEKRIQGVEFVLTKILKGKVNIGSMIQSSDRQTRRFTGSVAVEDRYAEPEVEITGPVKTEEYDHTYPLSLLIDHTEEIARKKEGAIRWSEKSANIVDSILSTDKTQANRLKIDVGSRNALFVYEMSVTTNVKNFDSMKSTFDTIFKTKGCDISLSEGNILVTIPLPKKFNLPIDVPSMYREVFFP